MDVNLKICGVCGDKALGYNFNAVTCESCKAFFRRNALTQKEFKCPFNQQCDITTITRRFCQRCRLEKCFAIGMRKDYIMSEEDKVLKRQKIEENRAKKREINGFKRGFKKIKRESSAEIVQSHDSEDEKVVYSDFDNVNTNKPLHVNMNSNGNLVSVISYSNNIDLNGSGNHSDSSSNSYTNEGLRSPEHVDSSTKETSMIRTILNPTPNGSIKNGEEDGTPLLASLVNNNVQNCNHNSAGPIINHYNNTNVAKDIIQDVQR